MKLQASAVKQCALEHSIPVAQPRSLRLDGKFPDDARAAQQAIADARADVMVVAAYGLILPQWVLDALQGPGQWGCLNIHGSLLPRWRGAAPIHRAIEAGDAQTGVTIMQMDAGLDTGDMLLRESVEIAPTDTTATLHDTLAELGAHLVVQALDLAPQDGLHAQRQPSEGVTYAHKIDKHEAQIDWRQSAMDIERKVRAFNPFPGCVGTLAGEVVKVWQAHVCTPAAAAAPGTVLEVTPQAIVVATGAQALALVELQRPGGKRLPAGEFVRGFAVQVGMPFAHPADGAADA